MPGVSSGSTSSRFDFEVALLDSGVDRIAGVDEAGRGPLAGPVVAAAVVFPRTWIGSGLPAELRGLNDSKQVSPGRRETFFEFLAAATEVGRGVSVVDVEEIDRVDILRASHAAMVRALHLLPDRPDHVLVDGLRVDSIPFPQTAIVKGDSRSYSIAAASILAKVTRDRIMEACAAQWPAYGFARHKGYPTSEHLQALARFGPCPIHRRSFRPVALVASQPELWAASGGT